MGEWRSSRMPHTNRKKRAVQPKSRNTMYIAAGILIVALVGGTGFYLYTVNSNAANTSSNTASCGGGSKTSTSSSSSTSPFVYARIDTTLGCIEVELFPSSAPATVANFVSLANSGFYSNLVWHRIVAGFVVQTGDSLTKNGGGDRSLWGTGGSGHTVPLEVTNTSLRNDRGYLGMARGTDINSGTSQFYINLASNPTLDGKYTVFGKVITGMAVVDAIASVPVNSSSQPINPVFVTSITILPGP
ncbi:MAG: peptidylprolyl isomerase [Thaumarchaeota archaeon]|nr:peptidylprolyl isomerase [Nitrososphaerota archaeon]